MVPRFLVTFLFVVACPIVIDGQPYTLPAGTPDCVSTKFKEFGDAVIANAQACVDACKAVDLPDPNTLFSNLNTDDLKTCSGFQKQIMDPICKSTLATCCSGVVPQFIEIMNCVVQDGLQATPAPCQLTCSSRRRELRGRELLIDVGDGSVVEPLGTAYVDDCANHLDPNGTGQSPTPDEMAAIMSKGDYLSCLATTTVTIANEKVAYDEYKAKSVIDMEWEIPNVGLNLGTAIGILLAVWGCCGICCSGYCYKRSGPSDGSKASKETDDDDS